MFKNPVFNALSASTYIIFVAIIVNFVSQTHRNKPDTFFTPIAVLSLFTLSAAVMAYLFFYQPLQLFIGGKKKDAVNLFMKTVGIFAIFTTVVWLFVLSGVV